jgi:hypothetical protein
MNNEERYRDALEFIRDVKVDPPWQTETWLREIAIEALQGINPRTGKPFEHPHGIPTP